jgi:hypothetical protein
MKISRTRKSVLPRVLPMRDTLTKKLLSRGHDIERSAFARGPGERELRIFIDADGCKTALVDKIRGFSGREHVRVEDIRADQLTLHNDGSATLDRSNGTVTKRCFFPSARANLDAIRSWRFRLPREDGIENRVVMAMTLGAVVGSDAFVTESRGLQRIAATFAKDGNVMPPDAALALLGLHLRLREDFVISSFGQGGMQTDATSFYSLVASDLLPQSTRWIRHCSPTPLPSGPSLSGLAKAVVSRLARALRSRDRLLGYLQREPSMSTFDEALFYFDAFLVALAGSFDASARVADEIYGLNEPKRSGWHNHKWLKAAFAQDARLLQLFQPDSQVWDAIKMLFLLRNTVHGETLRVVGLMGSAWEIAEYHASIPQAQRDEIVAIAKRRGGVDAWGVAQIDAEHFACDLGAYTEKLLPLATHALDALMKVVDVERCGTNGEDLRADLRSWKDRIPDMRLLFGLS